MFLQYNHFIGWLGCRYIWCSQWQPCHGEEARIRFVILTSVCPLLRKPGSCTNSTHIILKNIHTLYFKNTLNILLINYTFILYF